MTTFNIPELDAVQAAHAARFSEKRFSNINNLRAHARLSGDKGTLPPERFSPELRLKEEGVYSGSGQC